MSFLHFVETGCICHCHREVPITYAMLAQQRVLLLIKTFVTHHQSVLNPHVQAERLLLELTHNVAQQ
jgi:hypothetical protein